MATVNFCERCNTMGKSVAMGGIQAWSSPQHSIGAPLEICPGCVQDFHDFMAGKSVGAVKDSERPQSYSEPWTERKVDPLADLTDEQLAKAYLARVAERETANELTAGPDDGSL